jgi:hypothetical protein
MSYAVVAPGAVATAQVLGILERMLR